MTSSEPGWDIGRAWRNKRSPIVESIDRQLDAAQLAAFRDGFGEHFGLARV